MGSQKSDRAAMTRLHSLTSDRRRVTLSHPRRKWRSRRGDNGPMVSRRGLMGRLNGQCEPLHGLLLPRTNVFGLQPGLFRPDGGEAEDLCAPDPHHLSVRTLVGRLAIRFEMRRVVDDDSPLETRRQVGRETD
jgi:hypothetical protein